jgi:hypothetical protein
MRKVWTAHQRRTGTPAPLTIHALRVGQRPMSDCSEKFFVRLTHHVIMRN